MSAAIDTDGLTKRFGATVAVDHLDLRVEPGIVFGFLGPNGAGKTTTIRMLLDVQHQSDGSARVLGLDSRRESVAIHARCGYLPAELELEFHRLLCETTAGGATVFLSSHELDDVQRVADRVAIIRHGRLVVTDTLARLREQAPRTIQLRFRAPVAAACVRTAGRRTGRVGRRGTSHAAGRRRAGAAAASDRRPRPGRRRGPPCRPRRTVPGVLPGARVADVD